MPVQKSINFGRKSNFFENQTFLERDRVRERGRQ